MYYLVDSLSCQTTTADSCCSPTYGLVVLTLQWIPGWGPSDEFTVHGKFNSNLSDSLIFTNHSTMLFRFMARYLVSTYLILQSIDINVYVFISDGNQLSSSGCDTSRSSTTIATVVENADSALYTRMNTYWPSYNGDNNV